MSHKINFFRVLKASPDFFTSYNASTLPRALAHYAASCSNCTFSKFSNGAFAFIPTRSFSLSQPLRNPMSQSSPTNQQQLPPGTMVIPLPKLSHTMERGRLVKWRKQEGERVEMYDVLLEVETEEIAEEVFRVGDFAGKVTLLVESQEEGYLAKVLVPADPGRDLPVGTPLALFHEEEEVAAQLRQAGSGSGSSSSSAGGASSSGGGVVCPTTNVYDESQPQVKVLTWQSYLKSGKRQVKCMG